jgi:hypothetical protein
VFLSYRRNFKDSEAEVDPVPTPTLQPSASITSLTDLAQEMAAAEATAGAAAEATGAETTAETTEPTTMM